MKKLLYPLALLVALSFSGCQPDEEKPEPIEGTLKVKFVNHSDGEPISLDEMKYTNQAGNDYLVSQLLYYISNIKLLGCECGEFAEEESYHLIKLQDDPNQGGLVDENSFSLKAPVGTYKKIDFAVGVDEVRNHSGDKVDALDPINGMFWGWNTGYIFLKIEGDFNNSDSERKKFTFHIGGDEAYREITLEFDSNVEVKENETTELTIYTNVNEIFSSPNLLDFNSFKGTTSPGEDANMVADNYRDIFSLTKP